MIDKVILYEVCSCNENRWVIYIFKLWNSLWVFKVELTPRNMIYQVSGALRKKNVRGISTKCLELLWFEPKWMSHCLKKCKKCVKKASKRSITNESGENFKFLLSLIFLRKAGFQVLSWKILKIKTFPNFLSDYANRND